MAYKPIRSADDLAARLIVGETREDHWLDFKGFEQKTVWPWSDNDECRRDVVQFANASGGSVVVGAIEENHVLKGFQGVPDPDDTIRRLDEVLKGRLEPVPAIEPVTLRTATGEDVVVVNVPPSLRLVALRFNDDRYQFPIRAVDSKRYMTLGEIEARMQDQTRVHRLRLEQIGRQELVGLDVKVDANLTHNGWRVARVEEDVVVLERELEEVPIPLAYVETVYRAGLRGAEWIVALSCYLSQPRTKGHDNVNRIIVTKGLPSDRREDRYHSRGLLRP
jgi:hypothetical protein